jgi:hypothetical protein
MAISSTTLILPHVSSTREDLLCIQVYVSYIAPLVLDVVLVIDLYIRTVAESSRSGSLAMTLYNPLKVELVDVSIVFDRQEIAAVVGNRLFTHWVKA